MIRWLFLVSWSLFGTVLSGSPALIRSGDHPNFVRLVVDIPVGAEWEVGRVANGYAVRIEGVTRFETSNIFSRISTSRITGVTSQSNPIQLELNSDCECHATAFLWKDDKLVVDINDGPAPNDAKFEAALQNEIRSTVLPVITKQVLVPASLRVNPVPPLGFIVTSEEKTQLSDLEQVVIEGLARAATQGLLVPSSDLSMSDAFPSHVDAHFLRNEPGLMAHTSIDLGVESFMVVDDISETCLPDDYFDVASWANDLKFSDRITKARAGIALEFNKADPDAVIELARAYLVFGFGREAQNALRIDGKKSQERKILSLIGAIIDGDPVDESVALDAQLTCDGPASLWAFLAQTQTPKIETGRNNILRIFRSLPIHLQSHLGPMLSKKFRIIGDFEAAEMVLSREESGPEATMDAAIAQTELLTDLGKMDEAKEILSDLAATDSRMTPKALIDYLTLAVESGSIVDPEAITLGDILRFENKGDAIVGDLAAAQITALIAVDDLSGAFQLLAQEAESLGKEREKHFTSEVIGSASRTFSDAAFLDLAFESPLDVITPDVQNLVAARLLSLGLPERAAQFVAGASTGSAMMERRYLRAQAHLDVGDGDLAISELAGLSTDRAERILSQANLVAVGREEISTVSFGDDWKLGNWGALAQSEDALLQNLSLSMLSEVEAFVDAEQPLADGRRLLSESLDMRNLLDEMLTRFEAVPE